MTGQDDVDPSLLFQPVATSRNGPGTRHAAGLHNVVQQMSKGDIRRNFFSQRVVSPWNSLLDSVKSAGNVNTFKNRLDEHDHQA